MLKKISLPLLILLTCLLIACDELVAEIATEANTSSRGEYIVEGDIAKVTNVIDGDTIDVRLDGEEYRVRYISVDTPERDMPFYKEATKANRDLVSGQDVILVKDVSETDKFGRLLRFVYLEDGTFVNEELIAQGYAQTVTFPPDVSMVDTFREIEREAREAQRGLWGGAIADAPDGCFTCSKNSYNCADFSTQSQAQGCFDYCMVEVGEDIHRLDGGGDGLVCERLP